MKSNKNVSLRELLALLMADIHIYLLLEDDQETIKNKLHTSTEIQNQLLMSLGKIENILEKFGYNIDKPITFIP